MARICYQIAIVIFVTVFVISAVKAQRRISPFLETNPRNGFVNCEEGNEVVVSCHDASNGHYDVEWSRDDGQPLPSDCLVHDGELRFSSVRPHDAGRYVCTPKSYRKSASRRCRREVTVLVNQHNQFCGADEWCCGDGQCVSEDCFCNGLYDCDDGTDEVNCPRMSREECKWTDWSRCNDKCKQYRHLYCYKTTGGRGKKSVERTEYRYCTGPSCELPTPERLHCDWSDWSECSVSCGQGIRTRHCLPEHTPLARYFAERNMNPQVMSCQVQPCPVDGGWSAWNQWSACRDDGRVRTRVCNNPRPLYGGMDCVGPDKEFSKCYICSSALAMHLKPDGFTKRPLGQVVRFECGYCGSPMERVSIELDTSSPRNRRLIAPTSRGHTYDGNCTTKEWNVKLAKDLAYVRCFLKDSRMLVLGSLTSYMKVIGENEKCDAEKQFCCANEKCIYQWQRCNGHNDCDDDSDEAMCKKCTQDAFHCPRDEKCLPASERCDGTTQCSDGGDEENCTAHNATHDDDYTEGWDGSAPVDASSNEGSLTRPRKHVGGFL